MSKYYKAEDLQKALIGFIRRTGIVELPYDYATDVLDSLPTIDIVACDECRWSDNCSQLIDNLEHTASTSLRWCSDGVRRAEGEWVHLAGTGYRCSNCNEYTKSEKPFHKPKDNNCPNCGAKMRDDNVEDD